jgi:hypothetical protein
VQAKFYYPFPDQLRLLLPTSPMAANEVLEDDRDTSLPSSALSPAEYRSFRGLANELDHTAGVNSNQVSFYSVLEFLSSFNGVNQGVVQQVTVYVTPMLMI